jgi:hypothetical protein
MGKFWRGLGITLWVKGALGFVGEYTVSEEGHVLEEIGIFLGEGADSKGLLIDRGYKDKGGGFA